MGGMASASFDTFQAARALESAGVERVQAEAIVEAIQQRQNYASKADVTSLGIELRTEIHELGAELRTEIHELGTELRTEIHELGTELRGRIDKLGAEIGELRSEHRADMAALETRLTNRMYAIAVGLAAVVAAFGLFT